LVPKGKKPPVNLRTVDHLFSAPLWEELMARARRANVWCTAHRSEAKVDCCYQCNQLRACISTFYGCLLKRDGPPGPRFVATIRKYAQSIEQMAVRIEERVSAEIAALLMIEIRAVRNIFMN